MEPRPGKTNQSWVASLIALGLGLVMLAAMFVGLAFLSSPSQPGNWTYSQLIANAKAHRVSKLTIDGTSGTAVDKSGKTYDVTLPSDTSGLSSQLATDGVNVQYQASWLDGLGAWLPTLLLLGAIVLLFWWLMRGTRATTNRATSFGRTHARDMQGVLSQVTFADVAGVEEAQQEMSEVVEFLKTPDKFAALGARIPKGVLMIGPPGTGKTLLAKAVAGEAGVPFFSISGSEFVEMFVGVGASRVRDLFAKAKEAAPCIVFVDEIDAVGRRRGLGMAGSNDEREQTLNQLLVEMDGFGTNTYVIVMAATNRPDVLDPALLRAGRFDRHVTLDVPDRRGRRAILGVHVRNKPLAPDVDLDVVASQRPGFCGADLYNLANEAAILAARANRDHLITQDFEEAIALVIAGPERKSMLLSGDEKRTVAYHEAGHTLVMKSLPGCDHVRRVSIISRGSALGWTLGLPDQDRRLLGDDVLRDQLAGLLGGRASEEITFGRVTSGAENDLEKATDVARRMVVRWGMSERLGAVTLAPAPSLPVGVDGGQAPYSEATAAAVDEEVRRLVEEAHATARRVLVERRPTLEVLARRLMDE
ncbi:MAG: ATP-dependent zinc metalloprotease FtsH, partial [Candidatus Dormibacteraeota bacterium]|nr:ATP-dependent zinc metalloprotease FtsH [Candidatus Dormibacteraeota bacterium]